MQWSKVVRPNNINEMILPEKAVLFYNDYVASFEKRHNILPSVVLHGPTGTGKTSFFKILIRDFFQMGSDSFGFGSQSKVMYMNAGLERGINVIRKKIEPFCHGGGNNSDRLCTDRFVIMDEADNLTIEAKNSLKGLMEKCAKFCSFVFVCNNLEDLGDAIFSRCTCISFPSLSLEETIQCSKKILHKLSLHNDEFEQNQLGIRVLQNEELLQKICIGCKGDGRRIGYALQASLEFTRNLLDDRDIDSIYIALLEYLKCQNIVNIEESDLDGEKECLEMIIDGDFITISLQDIVSKLYAIVSSVKFDTDNYLKMFHIVYVSLAVKKYGLSHSLFDTIKTFERAKTSFPVSKLMFCIILINHLK